jgi:hypothetical protein
MRSRADAGDPQLSSEIAALRGPAFTVMMWLDTADIRVVAGN